VPPIRTRNPNVHVAPELERIVRRLLEKDPADRFATAEEVIDALDRIDETFDYGISEGMAALVLGDELMAERYLPVDEIRPRRLRQVAAGLGALAATGLFVSLVIGGVRRSGEAAEMAAHPVEPAATTTVALADRPVAPAEDAPRPQPAPAEIAAPTPAPSAARPVEPTPRPARSAPARRVAPSRRPAALARASRSPLDTSSDADSADLDTPAHLAAIASPPPGPDVSVERLIEEYRQVGQAIARMHGEGDRDLAGTFRDRYFQIPYADALRIPSVRRDTLAQLAALRRDLSAASAQR